MEKTLINVGVAQIKDASSPSIIRTILGSCVGICIYERMRKIGGIAHILLPSEQSGGSSSAKPEKYADTAIPMLVDRLLKEGAKKEFLSAKLVGGASMFKFASNIALGQIGERNVEESKNILNKLGIPIVVEDVGGNCGRVIDFYLDDGHLKVKAAGKEKVYYKN